MPTKKRKNIESIKSVSFDGQLVTESRDFAEMVERPDNELIKPLELMWNI